MLAGIFPVSSEMGRRLEVEQLSSLHREGVRSGGDGTAVDGGSDGRSSGETAQSALGFVVPIC